MHNVSHTVSPSLGLFAWTMSVLLLTGCALALLTGCWPRNRPWSAITLAGVMLLASFVVLAVPGLIFGLLLAGLFIAYELRRARAGRAGEST